MHKIYYKAYSQCIYKHYNKITKKLIQEVLFI